MCDVYSRRINTPCLIEEQAPSYRERVASLIERMKHKAFHPVLADGENCPSPYDLLHRFSIVDAVQRLGIHRFFENEIKAVLDHTYKYSCVILLFSLKVFNIVLMVDEYLTILF